MADIKTNICGIEFPNPVFTAAGPTAANAELLNQAIDGGAGGLVTKTISVQPAKVPIPNISSPFSGSLLNAELWSEIDCQKFISDELIKLKSKNIPIIASVGYSSEDLKILGKILDESGLVDAVEFSIHYVGKDTKNLINLALSLKNNFKRPVFAKLSPSVSNLSEVIKELEIHVDGFVAVNSVGPALDFDIETLEPYLGSEDGRGWLSGKAILPIGLHFVASIASLTNKPVIGVGGIWNVEDIVKYIMAGASAVQVCSLSILKGQNVYGELAKELSQWMDDHNYSNIESLRGIFNKKEIKKTHTLYDGPQLYPDIKSEKCNLCKLCVKSCVHQAIQFPENSFELTEEKCVSCGLCTTICSQNALFMKEKK